MIGLFIGLYVAVAVFAAVMTYVEQLDSRNDSLIARGLGFLACLFWPLTFITVATAVYMDSSSS